MSNLMELRVAAHEIFGEAMRAVDPGDAVRRAVRLSASNISIGDLKIGNRRVYAIAVGKAGVAMATALDQILGQSLTRGVLVDPRRLTFTLERPLDEPWLWTHGGHPLPTRGSFSAAERVLELLDRANSEHALVIFLISGGGSAMIEWPINSEISLANIRIATKVLIRCGASIGEINAVRRAYSFIKGGRLASKAPNCDQITLIVSDVRKGEEWNVASGLTWAPPADAPSARDVVAHYELGDRFPLSIMRAIESAPSAFDHSEVARHKHFVLLDNDTALEAAANAARARGFVPEIARDIIDGPIEVGCETLLTHLSNFQSRNPESDVCLISGGEFACPVRGEGIGGRNLETALRLAMAAEEKRDQIGEFVALLAGTDGIDGNSPAAGAIIDSTTIERSRKIGLDANDYLNRSDSYSFFVALGDAIETGPTGTNVRDLRILVRSSHRAD
jgi:hydroxypyruvate reductase